jgi:acetoin utilization deacetylase AcuC-like enzyme
VTPDGRARPSGVVDRLDVTPAARPGLPGSITSVVTGLPTRAIAVSVTIYCNEIFFEHRLEGHPESPERLAAILTRLRGLDQHGVIWRGAADPVSDGVLELVHPAEYWHALRDACAAGSGWLDADTYFTPASYDVARRAVGTSVECATRTC